MQRPCLRQQKLRHSRGHLLTLEQGMCLDCAHECRQASGATAQRPRPEPGWGAEQRATGWRRYVAQRAERRERERARTADALRVRAVAAKSAERASGHALPTPSDCAR
jgi:hypothetical protein